MNFNRGNTFYRNIAIATFVASVFVLYGANRTTVHSYLSRNLSSTSTCTPEEWSNGYWRKKRFPKVVKSPQDVYEASGFQGCASNREVDWHLSFEREGLHEWSTSVHSYEWVPGSGCGALRNNPEDLVVDLIENGGWFIVGDSVSEEHMFSVSCFLYPHVRATPDWTKPGYNRSEPQHLYLNPDSPLREYINFPPGFDINVTPLVSFRRVDLLTDRAELQAIHNGGHTSQPASPTMSFPDLFGAEESWDLSWVTYYNLFFGELPHANYRTLIVSTGGHWSLKLFAGLKGGYPEIFDLFKTSMTSWTYQIARYLDRYNEDQAAKANSSSTPFVPRKKQVIVRPYLPGDDNCHAKEIELVGPVARPKSLEGASYNWGEIPRLNEAFRNIVQTRGHPDIHYLPIDRPGRLRPDAHTQSDCLHWAVGAGVIEGWTQYIAAFTNPSPRYLKSSRVMGPYDVD